jgi:sec-independent protein translocase protein TatC
MSFPDDPQGASAPSGETSPHHDAPSETVHAPEHIPEAHVQEAHVHVQEAHVQEAHVQEVTGDVISGHVADDDPNSHGHYDDSYAQTNDWSSSSLPGSAVSLTPSAPVPSSGGAAPPPKPPDPPEEDEEEDGMARMSFLEHLEELRKRLILALGGIGASFALCLLFSEQLWDIVRGPANTALTNLKVNPPVLHIISPMDGFQVMWMKIPLLFSIFLASPWVLYQVWAFISPGLYNKEKRYAFPFVASSAGLFIAGGFFAYFVALRFGLEFLLGMGLGKGVEPGISLTEYYDVFVDVMLGVGIVFEIPILLFLLTLLHIVKPAFLVRHSRYAILAIVILAAFITPTGDVFNLALFATPMILLFYVGIFASYILVLRREKQKFPWLTFFKWLIIVLAVLSVIFVLAAHYYGYHFSGFHWPVFTK